MITISNSKGLWSKFKNYFSTNTSPQDLVEETKPDSTDVVEKVSSNPTNEEIAMATKEGSTVDINNAPLFSPLQDPDPELECLKSLDNYDETVFKRVIFKIDKSKFEYPYAKSTTLLTKTNLPIIKSIQSTQEMKKIAENIPIAGLCTNKEVFGSYSFEYTEASVKLLIDFSIALYQQIDPNQDPCAFDINNLDIYALENGTFLNEPFEFCYVGDCRALTPYDFEVLLEALQSEVSPVCEVENFYLYAVDVSISIKFLKEITIITTDTEGLAKINTILEKDVTNNVFTRGELASITSIDFSNVTNLDYNLFVYLPNLRELNISNTSANTEKLEKLQVLKQLKVLIALNNNITDFTPLGKLTSLEELYLDNLLITGFSIKSVTILATCNDISPLANLVNLKVLNLTNNNVCSIPSEFGNLTKLTTLNLDDNNIEDLSNLELLPALETFSAENNPIDPKTIPEKLPITHLNLSNTMLTQEGLLELSIPSTLQTLDISKNTLYDLTCLYGYNLTISAENQSVNYGSINPDVDNPSKFILDVSFIKDVDEPLDDGLMTTIEIYDISNGGEACEGFSCFDPTIIWKDITSETEATFKFRNKAATFTGTVTVILTPNV